MGLRTVVNNTTRYRQTDVRLYTSTVCMIENLTYHDEVIMLYYDVLGNSSYILRYVMVMNMTLRYVTSGLQNDYNWGRVNVQYRETHIGMYVRKHVYFHP